LKLNHEKINDTEIDILDIIDKEFNITDKINVTLICKSDRKGNVFLPRLVVQDENSKKTHYLEKLINFYCIDKLIDI